jgi:hypothetical protein
MLDLLNGLKTFFAGASPFVAVLTTLAAGFLWRSNAKKDEKILSLVDQFAKQIDEVQAEHVKTAKEGLAVAGALAPLVADVRDELIRRGRQLRSPPKPAEVKPP